MLVDAERAKEKLAKVCLCADRKDAIRAADLSDCRPTVSESGETYLGQIEAEERIESLSAQVAELKKAAERWQKARTLPIHIYGDEDQYGAYIYHSGTSLDAAIDAAKEGK